MIFFGTIVLGLLLGILIGCLRQLGQYRDYQEWLQDGQRTRYEYWRGTEYTSWKQALGDGILMGGFWGLLVGGITAFFAVLFVSAVASNPYTVNPPDPPARMLNLSDRLDRTTEAHGAFVLIAGGYSSHTNVNLSYSFYQRTNDGSYFLHTIKADDDTRVRIHFIGDGQMPYAIRKQPTKHWATPSWIAPFDVDPDDYPAEETWTLYVPRGTIVNQFQYKLDGH